MKIKSGFVLRDVAGKTFVVATGELSKTFKGMITLNETGKYIWKLLENEITKEEIINLSNKFLHDFMSFEKTLGCKWVDNASTETVKIQQGTYHTHTIKETIKKKEER